MAQETLSSVVQGADTSSASPVYACIHDTNHFSSDHIDGDSRYEQPVPLARRDELVMYSDVKHAEKPASQA